MIPATCMNWHLNDLFFQVIYRLQFVEKLIIFYECEVIMEMSNNSYSLVPMGFKKQFRSFACKYDDEKYWLYTIRTLHQVSGHAYLPHFLEHQSILLVTSRVFVFSGKFQTFQEGKARNLGVMRYKRHCSVLA